jgi:mycofactocin precursor
VGSASRGGAGTRGSDSLTLKVFHDRCEHTWRTRQNGRKEANVTPDTLTHDATTDLEAEVEELLVEEVSIDGLCGVY